MQGDSEGAPGSALCSLVNVSGLADDITSSSPWFCKLQPATGPDSKSEQTTATRWRQTAAGTWPHQNAFHLGCWHFSTSSIKQHALYMLTCVVHCTPHPKPFRCHTAVFQYVPWSRPYQCSLSLANLLGLLQSIENKIACCL